LVEEIRNNFKEREREREIYIKRIKELNALALLNAEPRYIYNIF